MPSGRDGSVGLTARVDLATRVREARERLVPKGVLEAYTRQRAKADLLYAGHDSMRRHEWANKWVAYALKKGILIKPSACENCQRPEEKTLVNGRTRTLPGAAIVSRRTPHEKSLLQAHHPDYRDLNRVEWLCDRCHNPIFPPSVLNPAGAEGERLAYIALREAHGDPYKPRARL